VTICLQLPLCCGFTSVKLKELVCIGLVDGMPEGSRLSLDTMESCLFDIIMIIIITISAQ